MNEDKLISYKKRLSASRSRLMNDHPFFGLLLLYFRMEVIEGMATAGTNGEYIRFSPEYLDALSDEDVDYLIMHELLHVVLGHCYRGRDLERTRFNLATDIVVNSTILHECEVAKRIDRIKYRDEYRLTPNGKEGYLYTAEEVYQEIIKVAPLQDDHEYSGGRDSHDGWRDPDADEQAKKERLWKRRVMNAAQVIAQNERYRCMCRGDIPEFAKRVISEIKQPQIDWRTALLDFVQEEINDYSFSPPDRRFQDASFFLPDFNDKDSTVRNLLYMIDTSASMDEEEIAAVFSEIYGAIEQFGGKLSGLLGFFDAEIIPAVPFEDAGELLDITPKGGGGTDFGIIFDYVRTEFEDDPPVSIIVMTDGYAEFPSESAARGIPVMWLLTAKQSKPPWGRIAYINMGRGMKL